MKMMLVTATLCALTVACTHSVRPEAAEDASPLPALSAPEPAPKAPPPAAEDAGLPVDAAEPPPVCFPDPRACSGRTCGTVDDGCGELVSCGACGPGSVCRREEDTAACCVPRGAAELCQGVCVGAVVDPCTDRSYECSALCAGR